MIAIIKKSDYTIDTVYESPERQSSYGGKWGNDSLYEHIEYDPADFVSHIKAQDDGSGDTEIVEDDSDTKWEINI